MPIETKCTPDATKPDLSQGPPPLVRAPRRMPVHITPNHPAVRRLDFDQVSAPANVAAPGIVRRVRDLGSLLDDNFENEMDLTPVTRRVHAVRPVPSGEQDQGPSCRRRLFQE